ncbi:MAG: hypothetical protein HQK84_03640 [Nitrospinae bacterium]|nr:hypothetical protein [Nitrospinota bacterium]
MKTILIMFIALLFSGCGDTPESYVKKLNVRKATVSINREGMLSFSVAIVNKGDKGLSDIPIQLTCNVTVTGSTPKTETFRTGPFTSGERRIVSHTMGPFPVGIYTQPSCKYSIAHVEF